MAFSYRRGLVPLSADPVHAGHVDLVTKASWKCAEVVAFVSDNGSKRGDYTFSAEERGAFARRIFAEAGLDRVVVQVSDMPLTDAFVMQDCDVVVRGIRNAADRAYEEAQVACHDLVMPGFSKRVLYLNADPDLTLASSSLVKSMVVKGFDPEPFIPVWLKEALEERLLGQRKIAVTGVIASGKSYVAKMLAETLPVPAKYVCIDDILRELYAADFPGACALRRSLSGLFGEDILVAGGGDVDRRKLAGLLFAADCPKETRKLVDSWTSPLVDALYRRAIAGFRGIIVLEWAQLAEMAMGRWANNRAVVVESPDRAGFAAQRGISEERLAEMAKLQWSPEAKAALLEGVAQREHHGAVVRFVNRLGSEAAGLRRIRLLADEVMAQFGIVPPFEWEVDMGRIKEIDMVRGPRPDAGQEQK